jgi:signal transduction histidine kinase
MSQEPQAMEVIEHHRQAQRPDETAHAGRLERLLSRPAAAWLLLCAALALTALAWHVSLDVARQEAMARLARHTDELHARLSRRLDAYEALLRGGAGLFAAQGGSVSRASWKRFVDGLSIPLHYPGVQGLGVSQWLGPAAAVPGHEREVQGEGFPSYKLRPAGERAAYSAVVFIEPFTPRNQRAFGFDMFSEPTRRAALERARDEAQVAMSGVVRLLQEDDQQVQSGFLLYLPLYRGGSAPATVAARREALWGWVYAPFRVGDLMTGALDLPTSGLDFTLHDGREATGQNQFYDSRQTVAEPAHATAESTALVRPLRFGGHDWTVAYWPRDADAAPDTLLPTLVAAAGLTIDLLLFGMLWLLGRRKRLIEREVSRRAAEVRSRTLWLDAVSGLSPDGVLVFERDEDDELRLVFTNPAFSELFGLRPGEFVGLSEGATSEWLSGLAAAGPPLCALGPGDAVTVRLAGPPPRVLQRSMREDARQRVYYFSDITRESEVERLKNEFLTTAAHELRTPLASVYGFSELLVADGLPTPKRQHMNEIVHRQASVLKHLVDELLDLARLDARADHDFHRETVDLRALASLAAESVSRPEDDNRVALQLCDEPLWVEVDAAKLGQVLVNGLSNAQKYSARFSPICLKVGATRQEGQDWAVVQVIDQGIGMSPEQTARAFERFYRADPSGHVAGAGLGLAIIHDVVSLHGGRVDLHSELGVGTRLSIALPRRPTETARASAQTPLTS